MDYNAGDLYSHFNIFTGDTLLVLLAPSKESPHIWKCLDLTKNIVRLVRLGTPSTKLITTSVNNVL